MSLNEMPVDAIPHTDGSFDMHIIAALQQAQICFIERFTDHVETELAGGDPAQQLPGVASHLRTCPACREDYLGLREAVEHFGDS